MTARVPRRPLPATQAQVASLAGCCRQTVAKWQRGCQVHPAIEAGIRRAVEIMNAIETSTKSII